MSEPVNDANEQAQPEFQVLLQVVIGKDGQLGVTGACMKDEIFAYGLLEKVKLMVKGVHEPKVVRPQGNMLDMLRRNGNRIK